MAVCVFAGCSPPRPPEDDAAVGPDATLSDARDDATIASGDSGRDLDGCAPITEPDGAVSSYLCRVDANCFERIQPDGAARFIC